MTRFSSRRFVKMLRITALAMLMLAVLVNPVLAAVGDMHESGHDAAGILQLADDHHDDKGAGTQGEEPDLLHAFMHAAHCCSHLAAVFDIGMPSGQQEVAPNAQLPELLAPHSAPRSSVFRPPIAV